MNSFEEGRVNRRSTQRRLETHSSVSTMRQSPLFFITFQTMLSLSSISGSGLANSGIHPFGNGF